MAQDKTGLLVASLIAIVAIVGLVVLLRGGSTGAVTVIRGDLGPDMGFPRNEFLNSFEGNTFCFFTGVTESCSSGVECNNLVKDETWCAR